MTRWIHIYVVLLCLGSLYSCNRTETQTDHSSIQERLLEHLHDNNILPSYKMFADYSDSLIYAVDTFLANPSKTHLEYLQQTFLSVYSAWQYVDMFEFGPAMDISARMYLNTYPTDTTTLQQNISLGNISPTIIGDHDAQGFPALDYFLFGRSIDDTYHLLVSDSLAQNRQAYIQILSQHIRDVGQTLYREWTMSYGQVFKQSIGLSEGSGMGVFINASILYIERFLRDGKVGIPLGIRSFGITFTEKTEAYYSRYSLTLLKKSIEAFKQSYIGHTDDAYSVYHYLKDIEQEKLADDVLQQIQTIESLLSEYSSPLAQLIIDQPSKAHTIYTAIQQLVILWKVDVPSVMGILITYQDNDGD